MAVVEIIPPAEADKPAYPAGLEDRARAAGIATWFVTRDSRAARVGQAGQPDRPYGKQGRWLKPATLMDRVVSAEAAAANGGKVPYWWRATYDGRRDDERTKYAHGGASAAVPANRATKRKRTPGAEAGGRPVCAACGYRLALDGTCGRCGRSEAVVTQAVTVPAAPAVSAAPEKMCRTCGVNLLDTSRDVCETCAPLSPPLARQTYYCPLCGTGGVIKRGAACSKCADPGF